MPGCSEPDKINSPSGLTILGLDGATWEIIDPLIAKGQLPGFKKLKENGSWGYLKTYRPTESISIWTTIATGVSPSRHGLQTFTRRIPGTDQFIPSPGSGRRVPALWNMVSDSGKKVVAVKWFASWPAEKVNGAVLSSRLEAEDSEPRTYPQELFAEIDPIRHQTTMDDLPQPPLPDKPKIQAEKPGLISAVSPAGAPPMLIGQSQVPSTMFDDTTVWLAGKHVFNKFLPDLFMIYLKSTDRVQHFLWGAQSDDNQDGRTKSEAEAIYGWYRYYDSLIMDLLNDPSRVLIVLSDHGFHSLKDTPNPYYLWDIDFDRILEFCGLLIKNGTGTNWNQTSVYTYRPFPYDRAVEFRVNLKGREPSGLIDPTSANGCLKMATEKLLSIRNSENLSLFSNVRILADSAAIHCILNDSVSLDDQIFYDNRSEKLHSLIFQKGLPRGIHTNAPPGILAIHGPCIQAGLQFDNATVFDITPTALYALGLPIAEDFEGIALTSVFDPDWASQHPIRTIPTFGERDASDTLLTTKGDAQMLDELRSLGYIQ